MPDDVLVIDAGTSALRAVAVSADGDVTWSHAEPWTMHAGAPFAREIDAAAVRCVLHDLLDTAPPSSAIAFTGQREGVAFLDGRGDALLVSPNIDGRASAEGMAFDAAMGAEIYAATGRLPSLILAPAKLAWLRANRPDDAARVRAVVPVADWLAYTLTGERAMSRSLAVEIGVCDVATGEAPALLDALDVPLDLLPSIVDDGAITGTVREGAHAGTPVILAGGDTQCAMLGMAGCVPGDADVAAGWSAPVQIVLAEPLIDTERRTWTGRHVVADRWLLESNAGETGRAWEWACMLLDLEHKDAFALAATSPAGANDALAVIGPRSMHAAAMTAGAGALALPLPFVMSAPSRADVLRAVLESIAFAVRANVEQLERVAGRRIELVRLAGGMSRAPLFRQLLADATGRPIAAARDAQTTALGAAALASAALDDYASAAEAADARCRPACVLEPDLGVSAQYDDVYGRWSSMADRLAAEAW